MLGLHLIALVASIAPIARCAAGGAAPAAQVGGNGCWTCLDFINDCDQWYGGCYNPCTGPQPAFKAPECPCDDNPSDGIKRPNDCPKPKPGEVCKWFYTKCNERYGGCYPKAGPMPHWTKPTCKDQ